VKNEPAMTISDDEIVAGLKEGRENAYEAFIHLYSGRLLRWIRYQLRGTRRVTIEADAEEMLNTAFYIAMVKIEQYSPARGTFRGWLYTLTRNVVIDHVRKAARAAEVLLDYTSELNSLQSLPDDVDVVREARRYALRQAIEELHERDRLVIEMTLAGIRDADIAKVRDVQPQSIPALRQRAVERLRALLINRVEFSDLITAAPGGPTS